MPTDNSNAEKVAQLLKKVQEGTGPEAANMQAAYDNYYRRDQAARKTYGVKEGEAIQAETIRNSGENEQYWVAKQRYTHADNAFREKAAKVLGLPDGAINDAEGPASSNPADPMNIINRAVEINQLSVEARVNEQSDNKTLPAKPAQGRTKGRGQN